MTSNTFNIVYYIICTAVGKDLAATAHFDSLPKCIIKFLIFLAVIVLIRMFFIIVMEV
jgi:hypothetical protein